MKLIWLFMMLAGVLITVVPLVRAGVRRIAGRKWPIVEATIQEGNVVLFPEPPSWMVKITYVFIANGERHAGFIDGPRFHTEEEGHEHLKGIRNRKIQIRYNPENPDVSIEV